MSSLYIKCKTCGVEFKTGVQINEESFETTSITYQYETCPSGHWNPYDKKDFFFK